MKMSELKVRLIALIAATCCSIGIGARSASAQTVTLSPSSRSLSFGVPTGSTTSAPQAVTISVGGSGSVTVSNIAIRSSTRRLPDLITSCKQTPALNRSPLPVHVQLA